MYHLNFRLRLILRVGFLDLSGAPSSQFEQDAQLKKVD